MICTLYYFRGPRYALTLDLFFVIGALFWFLAGIVANNLFGNPSWLDAFGSTWQPVILPAMTVLMGGTIAGGLLSGGEDDVQVDVGIRT